MVFHFSRDKDIKCHQITTMYHPNRNTEWVLIHSNLPSNVQQSIAHHHDRLKATIDDIQSYHYRIIVPSTSPIYHSKRLEIEIPLFYHCVDLERLPPEYQTPDWVAFINAMREEFIHNSMVLYLPHFMIISSPSPFPHLVLY